MKFYFCQGCGRRITEKDIAAGEGRDKKLKGVFCTDCAVGVTTMESLPLTQQEAEKVVKDAASEAPQRPRRRTTGAAATAGTRDGALSPPSSRIRSDVPSQSSPLKFVIPAVVAAVVAFGGLMLWRGSGSAPQKNVTSRKSKERKAKSAEKKDDGKSKPESVPVNDSPKSDPSSKVAIAEQPSPPLEPKPPSPEAHSPGAKDGPKKVVPAVPAKPEAEPKKVGKPEPPNTEPPEAPAPTKPDETAAARAKLAEYLKAFDEALSGKDLVAACQTAERAKADPLLKKVQEEVLALGRVGEALKKAEASRQRALEALRDGKERTFQTAKNKLTGVVRKIEDGVVKVRVKGRINRQVIEYEKSVKLSDLTPACRAELLGEKEPATSDGWMAVAAKETVERDLTPAEKALKEAGAHSLAPHYRERLAKLRLEVREANAERFWEERMNPLVKITKFTKVSAGAGTKTLASFQEAYGKTAFAASKVKEIKALKHAYELALGPPRERILDLGDGLEMEFVWVKPGTFTMGDPPGEKGPKFPQCEVTLTKGFYLGRYEVTLAQYGKVMGARRGKVSGKHPMANVSWHDAVEFCEKLGELKGCRARLPTDAEWEHACRAGSTTRFSFGDSDADAGDYCWFKKNARSGRQPVGKKKPNPLGLYDMHGNVWEWCQDWCVYDIPKTATDPKGPDSGKSRAIRGGSWNNPVWDCRSARRAQAPPDHRFRDRGFRVALDL